MGIFIENPFQSSASLMSEPTRVEHIMVFESMLVVLLSNTSLVILNSLAYHHGAQGTKKGYDI